MGKVNVAPRFQVKKSNSPAPISQTTKSHNSVSNFSSASGRSPTFFTQMCPKDFQTKASSQITELQHRATIKVVPKAQNKDAKIETQFDEKSSELIIASDQPFAINIMSDSPVFVNQHQKASEQSAGEESKIEAKTVAYSSLNGC